MGGPFTAIPMDGPMIGRALLALLAIQTSGPWLLKGHEKMIGLPWASKPTTELEPPERVNQAVLVPVVTSSLLIVVLTPWGSAELSVPYAAPAASACQ